MGHGQRHPKVQIDITPQDARFGINVVSQSANLGRLTRARILRPPKVGKRKRQERTRRARAASKMGKEDEDGGSFEFLSDGQRTQGPKIVIRSITL